MRRRDTDKVFHASATLKTLWYLILQICYMYSTEQFYIRTSEIGLRCCYVVKTIDSPVEIMALYSIPSIKLVLIPQKNLLKSSHNKVVKDYRCKRRAMRYYCISSLENIGFRLFGLSSKHTRNRCSGRNTKGASWGWGLSPHGNFPHWVMDQWNCCMVVFNHF